MAFGQVSPPSVDLWMVRFFLTPSLAGCAKYLSLRVFGGARGVLVQREKQGECVHVQQSETQWKRHAGGGPMVGVQHTCRELLKGTRGDTMAEQNRGGAHVQSVVERCENKASLADWRVEREVTDGSSCLKIWCKRHRSVPGCECVCMCRWVGSCVCVCWTCLHLRSIPSS